MIKSNFLSKKRNNSFTKENSDSLRVSFLPSSYNIISNQQKGLQPKNNIVIEKNDFGLLKHMPFYCDDKYNLKQYTEVKKDYSKILDDDGSLFEPLTLKQTKKKKCCCC